MQGKTLLYMIVIYYVNNSKFNLLLYIQLMFIPRLTLSVKVIEDKWFMESLKTIVFIKYKTLYSEHFENCCHAHLH